MQAYPTSRCRRNNDLQAQGVGTVATAVRQSRAGNTLSTIEARGLTKRYGDKLAVDDLSFEVKPGHVTGFLGPNGAGKSTTMRLIMGLDAPSSGSVTVNGRHYHDLGWPLREVGALLEAKAIHPGRSAYSHLRMLAQTNHIPKSRVEEMLDLVGLSAVALQLVGNFSLGMGHVSASRRRCSVTLACCCSTSRSTASILTGFVGYATSCDVSRPKADCLRLQPPHERDGTHC